MICFQPSSGRSSVEPTNTAGSDIAKQDSFNIDTSGFPSAIFGLQNLTELALEYQGIKSVPDAIKNLTALTMFSLKYCIELETLSAQVGFLPLKSLNLTGCGSLKTPPIEITRRGHQQTMAFLRRLVSGSTPCKRTKLMLVGLGGAGKTSLVRYFLQSSSKTPPVVTDGIDILKWKVPVEGSQDYLEFSVWDFAGQSVYYHTHQVRELDDYLLKIDSVLCNLVLFGEKSGLYSCMEYPSRSRTCWIGFLAFIDLLPCSQCTDFRRWYTF